MTRLEHWYLRLAQLTVITLFLVVLAGACVRATGSGMGCPDWPKCFGRLIPPTHVTQISQEFIAKHPEYDASQFNAARTWTEYINRLIGAASGILLLATLLSSFGFWKRDRATPLLYLGAMAFSALAIWLGKTVVDQNLRPRQVTIHMLSGLTLVMGTVLVTTRLGHKLRGTPLVVLPSRLRQLLWLSLALVIGQILLGTQMRERVDALVAGGNCLCENLEKDLGPVYILHRLLAALVVFSLATSFFWLRARPGRPLHWLALVMGALVGLSYLAGVLLVRFHMPAALQPAHLVLGTLLLGTLVAMLCSSKREQAESETRRH